MQTFKPKADSDYLLKWPPASRKAALPDGR